MGTQKACNLKVEHCDSNKTKEMHTQNICAIHEWNFPNFKSQKLIISLTKECHKWNWEIGGSSIQVKRVDVQDHCVCTWAELMKDAGEIWLWMKN